jgi:hypothetical protein
VSADAATLFMAFGVLGSLKSFAALEATEGDVDSLFFFAMICNFCDLKIKLIKYSLDTTL